MATIVNARDVLLQAASARVAGVTQTNLQVDQSQVSGLGLVLTGVKRITTTPSAQVFLIPTSGSPSPASITIAVNTFGFASVPTLSVLSGTLSPIPTAVDGVFTIPVASLTASAVLRVSAVDNSVSPTVTYTDDITILRQVEGNSTVVGYLSQEDVTLTADVLGNVSSYYGASGNFKVWQGTNDITSLCTFSLVSNTTGLTQTLNATTGAYAVLGGMPAGTSTATITYRATFGATTLDKTFTVRKSTASSGAPGAAGQRGSRTFYVTLSGATATFSDSLATTTASVDGGPIKNDVVQQTNSSVGFSQAKFWDGSAWQTINAIVDGNLLVTGTVGTNALAAKAVTTDKLLVTGDGQYVNLDPHMQDASAWTGGTFTLVTDGTSPNGRAMEITSGGATTAESRYYQIDKNKNYIFRTYAKNISGTSLAYIGLDFCDVNGASILGSTSGATGWPGLGSFFYFGLVGVQPPASYTEYSISFGPNETAKIPSGAVGVRIIYLANYNAAATQRFAKPTIMEKGTGALIVDGTITGTALVANTVDATKIDSRGLTIKDASGNVVFSSGGSNVIDGFRTTDPNPQDYSVGESKYFKTTTTFTLPSSGAATFGTLRTIRPYGIGSDFSGGPVYQWFESNNLVWSRYSTAATTWSAWSPVPNAQITSSNASTFIANAAIGSAQVGVLTAANLTVTALSNTINGSASSGQRVEVASNVIRVYDSSNVLRVKLGDLT